MGAIARSYATAATSPEAVRLSRQCARGANTATQSTSSDSGLEGHSGAIPHQVCCWMSSVMAVWGMTDGFLTMPDLAVDGEGQLARRPDEAPRVPLGEVDLERLGDLAVVCREVHVPGGLHRALAGLVEVDLGRPDVRGRPEQLDVVVAAEVPRERTKYAP